jgi:hypothetical protein
VTAPRRRLAGRGRRVGAGVVAVAAFLAGAWASGAISPIARRPVLDGTTAPPPYKYVSPPPRSPAAGKPAAGSFDVRMSARGSRPGVFATSDVQLTIVADRGMLSAQAGVTGANLVADPLDPSTLPSLGSGLEPQGNVYRVSGTFKPSGSPIRALDKPTQVILVYPAQPGIHQKHTVLYSADGRQWTPLDSTDIPNLQQVGADVTGLGYVVVGAPPATIAATPGSSPGEGGVPIAVWIVLGSVMLVGLGLATRVVSRRGSGSAER